MGTKHVVPRAEGQGGIGTATLGWGELFITNTTNDSATQGGKLTLTSNDGAAMQSGSRLGVIEFKGAESSSALTIGARIEAICDAVWSATENGASLKFYTTDANASESLVLTLDSNKLAVFSGAVAITGNLTVNGTTTTVNSTIVTIDDPVFTLGGDTAPVSETTQDKGIEFRYHTGSAAKIGFFGWDDSASAFTFIADATNNSEVFSGTAGNAIFTNITGTLQTAAQTNITSVGALNGGTITSGFGAINNGASAITTTGVISGGSLDIEGNADIDGTLEADVITVNGTALNTVIAGVTVTNATNSAHVLVTDNESTNENNLITFVEGATSSTGNVGLEMDGNLIYNPSTGTVTATAFSGNLTGNASGTAATVTGAAQSNITSLGTLTTLTVDNVVVNGTTIGHTSDTDLMTLASGALTVAGNVNVGSTLSVQANSSLATLELIGRTGSGFGGGLLAKSSIYSETSGSQYAANLVFKTNNGSNSLTERLSLMYNGDAIFSGDVGIGTTSPNYQLDIENSSHAVLRLHAGTNSSASLRLKNDAIDWDVNCQTNDTFAIYNHTSNIQPFSILPNGNVGIGTTVPQYPLQVKSGSNINFSISTGVADNTAVRLNAVNDAVTANIPMEFYATKFNFNNGNVGIGTGSPSNSRLTVSDGVAGYSTANILLQVKRNATQGNDDTSKASIMLANNSNAFQIAYGGATDRLRFINGGGTEQLTLLNGGNTGIGTTSPATQLQIGDYTDAAETITIATSQNGTGRINFYDNNDTEGGVIKVTGKSGGSTMTFAGRWNVDNPKVTFDLVNGNVGIGTSSPRYLLDFAYPQTSTTGSTDYIGFGVHNGPSSGVGTTIGSGIIWKANYSNYTKRSAGLVMVAEGNYFRAGLAFYTNGTADQTTDWVERMRISSTGTVGIAHVAEATVRFIVGGMGTSSATYNSIFRTSNGSNILYLNDAKAAYFYGTVGVAGSKNFLIKHPIESKRETHSLAHASIESPQVNNLYRGKVDLVNGVSIVNLDTVSSMTDGTFILLNDNVQCFTTNESNWDAVKGSVEGNILTITSQNSLSSASISWMVIGERKDDSIIEATTTDSNGKLIVEPPSIEEP